MRKKRLYFIGILGLVAAMAVAGVAISAPATQTIDGQVGGKEKPKFDKKKFKKTSIFVETTTSDAANPSGIPPKATNAKITFDKKDVKFDPKAVPGCDPNAIENTTTEVAKQACGNAIVGSGSAIASLSSAGARVDFPATVTAFNDASTKGILLHSRVDQLGTTVVLKGSLNKNVLNVVIPPLAGGAGAIAQFETTVKAGKYVQARCKDKKINYEGEFTFSDAPTAVATDTQTCKRKKK